MKLFVLLISFFSFSELLMGVSNISINDYKLVPEFNENIKKYNVFVNSKTEIIRINIDLSTDEEATGVGSISLKKGLNEIKINIYKNEELIDVYTLNIIRGETFIYDDEANLKDLSIEGFNIDFKSDIYEYYIDTKEGDTINLKYETPYPDMLVKVTKNSKDIYVKVTSVNRKVSNTYHISVNRTETTFAKDKSKKGIFDNKEFSKSELSLIKMTISLVILFIISILFYFIFIKKRSFLEK